MVFAMRLFISLTLFLSLALLSAANAEEKSPTDDTDTPWAGLNIPPGGAKLLTPKYSDGVSIIQFDGKQAKDFSAANAEKKDSPSTKDVIKYPENTPWAEKVTIKSPADYANTPWAKLNIPPGTKLFTRNFHGKELYKLEFSGGVSMSEHEGSNGRVDYVDNSPHGAVGCAWGIYVAVKSSVDECRPEEIELRKNIDLAIEKFKHFIVENSLQPITEAVTYTLYSKESR